MSPPVDGTVSILGHQLERGPDALGELTRTEDTGDGPALRGRLADDGYLYLPGFFERDGAQLVAGNEPLHNLLYGGRMIGFYESLLGGSVRHLDFTWLRIMAPGGGTWVHTDIVFMGRGTSNLFTSWVPYGDIPPQMGGLAILERSHTHELIREVYGRQDVDSYCENLGEQPRRLGGRWLTADYRAGDLLVFGMFTAHGALDNRTDRIRLSSDSRYQLAADPVDERWVGPHPAGHTKAGKRGVGC